MTLRSGAWLCPVGCCRCVVRFPPVARAACRRFELLFKAFAPVGATPCTSLCSCFRAKYCARPRCAVPMLAEPLQQLPKSVDDKPPAGQLSHCLTGMLSLRVPAPLPR
ncbi:hypothetical protein NDU88_004754 [Pleurodeles waltl]|uniref:Secreted protein n=1 Tax=Pleurodeles waltl TaxID=8319 RepID=A0AAV7NN73_PLEWA|nr:hypothetical protein NDU88_004754 [Pleurodeles waltl]